MFSLPIVALRYEWHSVRRTSSLVRALTNSSTPTLTSGPWEGPLTAKDSSILADKGGSITKALPAKVRDGDYTATWIAPEWTIWSYRQAQSWYAGQWPQLGVFPRAVACWYARLVLKGERDEALGPFPALIR